ncbi:ComF family protein [Corynebacterium sp. HMSC071B10]|uniref:ComF family protein n=1 Tax=Corynebacterium sp. HMSC071B10 TaxID=1739494 RepID=UPI000B118BFE|nr:phosphoribosyltransferase family protein [Corynebacterium sp. HMSC071B10]
MLGEVADLLLPRYCAGCGEPAERWSVLCARCRRLLARPPQRVFPKVTVPAPVFALGPYADAHRGVILAMKERNNLAVRAHVGAVLAAALEHLEVRGDIAVADALVPAPTRKANARARGGDPVRAVCEASGRATCPALTLRRTTADQAELDEAGRRANLQGAVHVQKLPAGSVVVVDDVVTTGATLEASVAALLARGVRVAGCVTLAEA